MEPKTSTGKTLTGVALVASSLLYVPATLATPLPADPASTGIGQVMTGEEAEAGVDYAAELAELVRRQQQQGIAYQETLTKLQGLIEEARQQQGKLGKQQQAIQSGLDTLDQLVRKVLLSAPARNETGNDPGDRISQAFFKRIAENQRQRNPRPPLLDILEQLHCAETRAAADQQLRQLFNISPQGQDWPDEWLGTPPAKPPALHAGTVDIALATLKRTAERFPDLRETAERIALQWNYCLTLENGKFFDLALPERHLQRTAARNAPLQWSGFRQWGFLPPPPAEDSRIVPRLLSEITLAPHAYQIFLHQAYRLHCFPHPVTGELYTETDANRGQATHSVVLPAPETPGQDYPYPWHPLCELPQVNYRPEPVWPQAVTLRIRQRLEHVGQELALTTDTLAKLHTEKDELENSHQQASAALEKEINTLTVREQIRQQQVAEALARQHAAEAEQARLAAERQKQAEAAAEREQQLAKAAEAAARQQQRAKEQARLAALKQQEETKARLAAAARKRALAAQLALEEQLAREAAERERRKPGPAQKKPKKTAYAAMQVPPKGMVVIPTAPSSALDMPMVYPDDTAKQGKGKSKNKSMALSGSVALSSPVKGGGIALNNSFTLTPAENMFATVATSYKDGQLTYAWSAGYSDWRPGTSSVQLNNWGPLKPGEGLAFDKAILNLGHKIDSDTLREYKLSTSVGLSLPVKGKASANATLQWSPGNSLYIRTTASQKPEGGPTNWSYGFGYADYGPGGWRVEYSNYGRNRHPFENIEKGTVTVSRGWKF